MFKKGQAYEIVSSFAGSVLTQWRAPYTGGYEKLLPVGMRFVIEHDPPPEATAVGARGNPYSEWEKILVELEDRQKPGYDGYFLVIPFEYVQANCRLLDEG